MTTQNNLDPKGEAGSRKCPLHLIPPVAMEHTAWVHKHGAEKYSKRTPISSCSPIELVARYCTCGRSTEHRLATQNDPTPPKGFALSATTSNVLPSNAHPATTGESLGLMGFANRAMTENFGLKIQNTRTGNGKFQPNGLGTTTITLTAKYENMPAEPMLKLEPDEIAAQQNSQGMGLMPSLPNGFSISKEESALYAKGILVRGTSTSTTAMLQENFVVSCVTDATKDLGYSETLRRILRQHSPTCGSRNLRLEGENIVFPGHFNWRKSKVCVTTYVAAIMRHLNAFRDGENDDPESGLPHLAHIGASVNILLDAQACGTLVDDRSIRVADEQTLLAEGRLELLNNQEKRHNLEMSALREELAALRLQLAKQITPS